MGEDPNHVFNVGCPRMDLIVDELKTDSSVVLKNLFVNHSGVGKEVDLEKPFLLVSQHPVTTEYGANRKQIEETLAALEALAMPTIMLWPNADAGSDDISKGIRTYREQNNPEWLYLFKNLPTHIYIHLMNIASCLVGNSSSGIREGAFIGTPVVNIGTRQFRRVRDGNVVDVDYDAAEIEAGVRGQVANGKHASSPVYGDGSAGKQIAQILAKVEPPVQKTICY